MSSHQGINDTFVRYSTCYMLAVASMFASFPKSCRQLALAGGSKVEGLVWLTAVTANRRVKIWTFRSRNVRFQPRPEFTSWTWEPNRVWTSGKAFKIAVEGSKCRKLSQLRQPSRSQVCKSVMPRPRENNSLTTNNCLTEFKSFVSTKRWQDLQVLQKTFIASHCGPV